MCENAEINIIFSDFQKNVDAEQEIREVIRNICKDIAQISREVTSTLQIIHCSEAEIGPACLKARESFDKAREGYKQLKDAIPETDYYRYHEHWRSVTQKYCFLITLTVWLEEGVLATQETVAQVLGISPVEEKVGFHLDIEDYLTGLLQMCSELARLAVNCVTQGNYKKPAQIFKFVMEMNAGFRLLNLKNDSLRKRFDVLKYDLKKIEEVVYDLSVREAERNDNQ